MNVFCYKGQDAKLTITRKMRACAELYNLTGYEVPVRSCI